MGKVMMSGVAPKMTVPSRGILASDLAVGSSVYLMEDGVAKEYLVVNQGIPEQSSLYDSSCDGLWLLRKNCYDARAWDSSAVNDYENSMIHAWLNGDFFNLLGTKEQSAIKQVKIPYVKGTGKTTVNSGADGLLTKIFLLSAYEYGFTTSETSQIAVEGAKLSYFESGTGDSACNKRVFKYGTNNAIYWLRSPYTTNTDSVKVVTTLGKISGYTASYAQNICPALVLPSTAIFDANTLILKGVS